MNNNEERSARGTLVTGRHQDVANNDDDERAALSALYLWCVDHIEADTAAPEHQQLLLGLRVLQRLAARCPFCGKQATLTWTDHVVPYGPEGPGQLSIPVPGVPEYSCAACRFIYTDHEAELIIDKTVKAYLAAREQTSSVASPKDDQSGT